MISSRSWDCARCNHRMETSASQPGTPMHNCPGFSGMTVPMREVGQDTDVRLIEREDYIGHDHVQTDGEGRPWMAAQVVRGDGSWDHYVYAPLAVINLRGEG